MKREIITTLDGSTTIHIPGWNECYHSKNGAIQEAYHVFIGNGLRLFEDSPISILEIGFGTGLNAFITYLESKNNPSIQYTGVEAYPVSATELSSMNYVDQLNATADAHIFLSMHECKWEQPIILAPNFELVKRHQRIEEISDVSTFDLIYFDAFGYNVQPELWTTAIFKRMHDALKPGGYLVTYAARGVVKRSMMEVGFTVEKLPGPPGKREMFRARKS